VRPGEQLTGRADGVDRIALPALPFARVPGVVDLVV